MGAAVEPVCRDALARCENLRRFARGARWRASCNYARSQMQQGAATGGSETKMKRRSMGLGLVAGLAVLAGALTVGCSSGGGGGPDATELGRGTLQLPLVTEGASGTQYRLRNATFEITSYSYYYYPYESGAGGEGGASTQHVTVSSEDDPEATSIAVSIERG